MTTARSKKACRTHVKIGTPMKSTGSLTRSTGRLTAKSSALWSVTPPTTTPPSNTTTLKLPRVCSCLCGLVVSPATAKVPSSGLVVLSTGTASTCRTATTSPRSKTSRSSATTRPREMIPAATRPTTTHPLPAPKAMSLSAPTTPSSGLSKLLAMIPTRALLLLSATPSLPRHPARKNRPALPLSCPNPYLVCLAVALLETVVAVVAVQAAAVAAALAVYKQTATVTPAVAHTMATLSTVTDRPASTKVWEEALAVALAVPAKRTTSLLAAPWLCLGSSLQP
jgi:hypothetical protein